MGLTKDGFSPATFSRKFAEVSAPAKDILFGNGGATRKAVHDLITVSQRVGQSRPTEGASTVQTPVRRSAGGGGALRALEDPLQALSSAAKAAGLGLGAAMVVTRPEIARAVSVWARAYGQAATGRSMGLAAASRNLAAKVNREFGVEVDPARLMGAPDNAVSAIRTAA
jgi:hypothetical protein